MGLRGRSATIEPTADRFWRKVNKLEGEGACWLWTDTPHKSGYGLFWWSETRRYKRAHQVAWFLTHGIWTKSPMLRHQCHTPLCVRPSHLLPGTAKDNANDCREAGHHHCETNKKVRKLSEKQAVEVVRLREEGKSYERLADIFNVSTWAIWLIIHGKTYRDVAA